MIRNAIQYVGAFQSGINIPKEYEMHKVASVIGALEGFNPHWVIPTYRVIGGFDLVRWGVDPRDMPAILCSGMTSKLPYTVCSLLRYGSTLSNTAGFFP